MMCSYENSKRHTSVTLHFKMATPGKWEVVGKPKKSQQSTSKIPKKISADNLPKVEASPPIEQSPTMYDALLPKEKRKDNPQRAMVEDVRSSHTSNGGAKVKPKTAKKPSEKKKEPTLTMEDAVKNIVASKLEEVLAHDQVAFPDNMSIWLKDLASMLNLHLSAVPMPDQVFADKPEDYPLCLLPKKSRAILVSTVKKCSPEILSVCLEHCIQSIITDVGKGGSTYGYCMFVQLLIQHEPSLVVNDLAKYLQMLNSQNKRPLRCLSIMWAVGQAGQHSLSHGLKVWLELMVPVLNIRALSTYSVNYLDNLFRKHVNLKSAHGTIDMRGFFPILDLIFSPSNAPNLSANQQKTLLALYPKIKHIAFGNTPQTTLRHFFPSFLVRCVPTCSKMLQQELLSCLVTCLATDTHCFSVWRQMYVKHLLPSSVLLQHLLTGWPQSTAQLDRSLLCQTVQAFSITSAELASAHTAGNNAASSCSATCKSLMQKMSRSRLPWCLLIMSVLAAISAVIYYDVYSSNGFKGSTVNRILTDTGLLAFGQQVYSRTALYSEKAFSWLEVNVPLAYSRVSAIARPYLVLFWTSLYELGVTIMTATAPLRAYLVQTAIKILLWVEETYPPVLAVCLEYLSAFWQICVHYGLIVWRFAAYHLHNIGTWLLTNVFIGTLSPENIGKALTSALLALKSYAVQLQQWTVQLVTGGTTT